MRQFATQLKVINNIFCLFYVITFEGTSLAATADWESCSFLHKHQLGSL